MKPKTRDAELFFYRFLFVLTLFTFAVAFIGFRA